MAENEVVNEEFAAEILHLLVGWYEYCQISQPVLKIQGLAQVCKAGPLKRGENELIKMQSNIKRCIAAK